MIALFSEKVKEQAEQKKLQVAASGAVPSAIPSVPTSVPPVSTTTTTSTSTSYIPTGPVPVREYVSTGPVPAREYVPSGGSSGAPSIPQDRYEEVRFDSSSGYVPSSYGTAKVMPTAMPTAVPTAVPTMVPSAVPSPARRFREIMAKLTQKPEFKNASRSLMSLFDDFYQPLKTHSQTVLQQTQGSFSLLILFCFCVSFLKNSFPLFFFFQFDMQRESKIFT